MASPGAATAMPPAAAGAPSAPAAAEAACAAWYEAHGPAIYNYIRFHVASPDVAEDLTAETFLRAVRAHDRYDPSRGDAKTWLFSIAANLLRDHARRSRVRQYVPLGSFRDLVCDAPSPEERLLHEESVARLLDAVARLPAGDREIIGLRYASGLDTRDVAELLGISEANVRTRLWRALKRLRAEVGE